MTKEAYTAESAWKAVQRDGIDGGPEFIKLALAGAVSEAKDRALRSSLQKNWFVEVVSEAKELVTALEMLAANEEAR